MSNRIIYEEIENELRAGRPIVQATVVQTKGSTPRKEGTTMLVRADGSLVGTVGGGCGEAGVIQKCRLSLLDGRHREELADLTEEISVDANGVCGGTLRVFIEPWQPGEAAIALAARLKALSDSPHTVTVHQVIESGHADVPLGLRVVVDETGNPVEGTLPPSGLALPSGPASRPHRLQAVGDNLVYTERWDPEPTFVIVGAGHVAEPLEHVGRLAGYRTVVVDDRTLFANRERFPEAGQVVCGPILDVMRQIELSPHHYLVLVTRGHTLDMDALRVLIERNEPVAYIGMIGSKRRVDAVFQLLQEEGFDRSLFDHVYSPVGLNIGAETPAEIAVAVLAEMTAVRRRAGTDTRSMTLVSGAHPSLRRKTLQPAG